MTEQIGVTAVDTLARPGVMESPLEERKFLRGKHERALKEGLGELLRGGEINPEERDELMELFREARPGTPPTKFKRSAFEARPPLIVHPPKRETLKAVIEEPSEGEEEEAMEEEERIFGHQPEKGPRDDALTREWDETLGYARDAIDLENYGLFGEEFLTAASELIFTSPMMNGISILEESIKARTGLEKEIFLRFEEMGVGDDVVKTFSTMYNTLKGLVYNYIAGASHLPKSESIQLGQKIGGVLDLIDNLLKDMTGDDRSNPLYHPNIQRDYLSANMAAYAGARKFPFDPKIFERFNFSESYFRGRKPTDLENKVEEYLSGIQAKTEKIAEEFDIKKYGIPIKPLSKKAWQSAYGDLIFSEETGEVRFEGGKTVSSRMVGNPVDPEDSILIAPKRKRKGEEVVVKKEPVRPKVSKKGSPTEQRIDKDIDNYPWLNPENIPEEEKAERLLAAEIDHALQAAMEQRKGPHFSSVPALFDQSNELRDEQKYGTIDEVFDRESAAIIGELPLPEEVEEEEPIVVGKKFSLIGFKGKVRDTNMPSVKDEGEEINIPVLNEEEEQVYKRQENNITTALVEKVHSEMENTEGIAPPDVLRKSGNERRRFYNDLVDFTEGRTSNWKGRIVRWYLMYSLTAVTAAEWDGFMRWWIHWANPRAREAVEIMDDIQAHTDSVNASANSLARGMYQTMGKAKNSAEAMRNMIAFFKSGMNYQSVMSDLENLTPGITEEQRATNTRIINEVNSKFMFFTNVEGGLITKQIDRFIREEGPMPADEMLKKLNKQLMENRVSSARTSYQFEAAVIYDKELLTLEDKGDEVTLQKKMVEIAGKRASVSGYTPETAANVWIALHRKAAIKARGGGLPTERRAQIETVMETLSEEERSFLVLFEKYDQSTKDLVDTSASVTEVQFVKRFGVSMTNVFNIAERDTKELEALTDVAQRITLNHAKSTQLLQIQVQAQTKNMEKVMRKMSDTAALGEIFRGALRSAQNATISLGDIGVDVSTTFGVDFLTSQMAIMVVGSFRSLSFFSGNTASYEQLQATSTLSQSLGSKIYDSLSALFELDKPTFSFSPVKTALWGISTIVKIVADWLFTPILSYIVARLTGDITRLPVSAIRKICFWLADMRLKEGRFFAGDMKTKIDQNVKDAKFRSRAEHEMTRVPQFQAMYKKNLERETRKAVESGDEEVLKGVMERATSHTIRQIVEITAWRRHDDNWNKILRVVGSSLYILGSKGILMYLVMPTIKMIFWWKGWNMVPYLNSVSLTAVAWASAIPGGQLALTIVPIIVSLMVTFKTVKFAWKALRGIPTGYKILISLFYGAASAVVQAMWKTGNYASAAWIFTKNLATGRYRDLEMIGAIDKKGLEKIPEERNWNPNKGKWSWVTPVNIAATLIVGYGVYAAVYHYSVLDLFSEYSSNYVTNPVRNLLDPNGVKLRALQEASKSTTEEGTAVVTLEHYLEEHKEAEGFDVTEQREQHARLLREWQAGVNIELELEIDGPTKRALDAAGVTEGTLRDYVSLAVKLDREEESIARDRTGRVDLEKMAGAERTATTMLFNRALSGVTPRREMINKLGENRLQYGVDFAGYAGVNRDVSIRYWTGVTELAIGKLKELYEEGKLFKFEKEAFDV